MRGGQVRVRASGQGGGEGDARSWKKCGSGQQERERHDVMGELRTMGERRRQGALGGVSLFFPDTRLTGTSFDGDAAPRS